MGSLRTIHLLTCRCPGSLSLKPPVPPRNVRSPAASVFMPRPSSGGTVGGPGLLLASPTCPEALGTSGALGTRTQSCASARPAGRPLRLNIQGCSLHVQLRSQTPSHLSRWEPPISETPSSPPHPTPAAQGPCPHRGRPTWSWVPHPAPGVCGQGTRGGRSPGEGGGMNDPSPEGFQGCPGGQGIRRGRGRGRDARRPVRTTPKASPALLQRHGPPHSRLCSLNSKRGFLIPCRGGSPTGSQ